MNEKRIEIEKDGEVFSYPKWFWDLINDGKPHLTQVEYTGTFWRIYVDGKAVGDTAIGAYQSSARR